MLAAWLAPTALMLLATLALSSSSPVQAQLTIQPVIVLDFSVAEGIDPIYGRKAADALAVELQRSGDYKVVERQAVETAVSSQAGLRAPFNESTQQRLAQAVDARSVFSGQVLRVTMKGQRSARVEIFSRQLDAATSDYVNAARVSEVTADTLQDVEAEVLVDEALNKAAFAAVREMRQTRLPQGTVLNTTREDVEINIGTRSGAAPGQRYSVLRDVINSAKSTPGNTVVERIKVGEIAVQRVEMDSAVATVVEAPTGVRTGDKVRQIFLQVSYPISPTPERGAASTRTGVLSPTVPGAQRTPKVVRKSGSALIGLIALAALASFAGLGGGGGGGDRQVLGVTATPTTDFGGPVVNINFSSVRNSLRVPPECIAGYFIYRGTTEGFAPTLSNLVGFVKDDTTVFTDDNNDAFLTNKVTITATRPTGTGTGGNTGAGGCFVNSTTSRNLTTAAEFNAGNFINSGTGTGTGGTANTSALTAQFVNTPLIPGIQYFYTVQAVTAERREVPGTGTGTGGGTTTTTVYDITLNTISSPSGGATAIPQPEITSANTNLDQFQVRINGLCPIPFAPNITIPAGTPRIQIPCFTNVDQFIVQVSTNSTFPEGNRFQQIFSNPGIDSVTGSPTLGQITFQVGDIIVPNFDPAEPVQIFVRVGVKNSRDAPGAGFVFSPPTVLNGVTSTQAMTARSGLVAPGSLGRSDGGLGLPGTPGRGNSVGRAAPGSIRRPGGIVRPRR